MAHETSDALVKVIAMLPVALVILLAGFVLFLAGNVVAYLGNRDEDGLLTGWVVVSMMFLSFMIAGEVLAPTVGALIGELIGRRRGPGGALVGAAAGALAGTAGMVAVLAALDATSLAEAAGAQGIGMSVVLVLAVLLHQHARRREVALNTKGSQPPG